ncbi:hypothetical protein GCM10025794_31760 [Massilia kyonggiensis]
MCDRRWHDEETGAALSYRSDSAERAVAHCGHEAGLGGHDDADIDLKMIKGITAMKKMDGSETAAGADVDHRKA